jgi:protein-L-isoaspartate(D-aspartate) O-methyltransferase
MIIDIYLKIAIRLSVPTGKTRLQCRTMNDLKEATRQETMIQQQVIERGIRDENLLAAMRAVPRERFLPQGAEAQAYADRAVPIGHDQTISQPYIVALMTQRLAVSPTDKVLEIGTGSGYQTAILSKLAGEVFTVERVKQLLDSAWERLMDLNLRNIHFKHGDGTLGWIEAGPFDRILITAGAPVLPDQLLLSQLRDGGVAVLPVGAIDEQMLVEIRRDGSHLEARNICPCRFVKLIGELGWK